jgi:hypothetical protein
MSSAARIDSTVNITTAAAPTTIAAHLSSSQLVFEQRYAVLQGAAAATPAQLLRCCHINTTQAVPFTGQHHIVTLAAAAACAFEQLTFLSL